MILDSVAGISAQPDITAREQEILQLISESFTSKEIAGKLFLSKRTIDFHRSSLLLKLDAKNAAMLVKKAIAYGLVK